MKIPFGLAQVTGLDIEHCALLTIIIGFHLNNKPCFMLNKPLASITGMSEKKVRQKLHNLQSAGWIEIRTGVKTNYSYFDRIITFTKDYKELEANLEKYEQKTLSFVTNDLDVTPNEIDTLTDLDIPKIDMTPIQNNTAPLSILLAPPTETDTHIILLDNDNRLVINKEEKNIKNSKINELIFQQQNEIDNIFNDIFDLSVKYDFDNIDNQIKLNDMLKSENMNKLKKTYLDIKRENTIERKTFQNTLAYHKNNLKINCLTSIWLYDYEILKLRMKYNADYFLKTIYKIDVWLQDPTNFAKKLDHYSTIENWIKKDIGHILEIKTHIRVDMYKYVNHGVDYDLFK